MENFAHLLISELGLPETELIDISHKANRFSMYKCGPVISVSHGMGIPSMSILLHEMLKLMYYAKIKNPIFLRLGTSGGVGVEPGTVVVSDKVVNGMLEAVHEVAILGKKVSRPAIIDPDLVEEIMECTKKAPFHCVRGTTMATDDFYEGQGRLDGAFCDYTEQDKFDFLLKLKSLGVVNIEMEATAFAAFCHHAGVQGGVICVTLVNRLIGDQISQPKVVLESWQLQPQQLAAKFIQKTLGKSSA